MREDPKGGRPGKGQPGRDAGPAAPGKVPPRPSRPAAPATRTQSSSLPAASPPRRTTTAKVPLASGPPTGSNPRATLGNMLAVQLGSAQNAEQAHRTLEQSAFDDDDEVTLFDARLGGRTALEHREPEEPGTAVAYHFDGELPHPALTTRDVYKSIQGPLQSRAHRRSAELYLNVLHQFAVGQNPRYEPDGPGKSRTHIFVWDVTRAMGVELPHFLGARQLSASQMMDWLRHEGPMKGWRRGDGQAALLAARQGLPVVAIPKDGKVRLMGMVRPGQGAPDGKPLLCAAGLVRGNGLTLLQAFGVFAVDFFVHD
jgi:hypothetical protein